MPTEFNVKLLGLVLLSSLPFLFTLEGDFVFDDNEAIIRNKDVQSASWTDCFYNDFWGNNITSNISHKSYRPLTVLTFRWNYFVNKELTAFPFKVINLLCHTVCCILVWLTFSAILKTNENDKYSYIDTSYYAALLFAVHPVHVEAICGIVGRADVLSGVMFFISFLFYAKAVEKKKNSYSFIYLLAAIILAAISMLCKENGVTVLGFCLFYDLINILNKKKKKDYYNFNNLGFFMRICITSMSTVLLLYGRWILMGATKPEFKKIDNPAAYADNVFTKIATFNYVYSMNSLLLLWPQWLCYDWSMGCIPLIQNILDFRILMPISMYIYAFLIIIALVKKSNRRKTKRNLMLSAALTVIPFLPASNIFFPVGFVIAERILYIPSAGYCLMVTIGLNKMILKTDKYKMGQLFYVLLLLTYGLKSWKRSYDWQNEYQLFMTGLSVCPLNAKVHYNAAKVANVSDNADFALMSYKEAIRLYPEYYQAMNNLANLLKYQKKYSEAEFYYRNSIRFKHNFPAAWMNLGILLASTNRLEESEIAYKTAMQYRKIYPDCLYNLGNLYLTMNRNTDAKEKWLQTVKLNPKHVLAWTNLIALLDNTEQLQYAMEIIPKALKELPDAPSINFAVANIYGKMNRLSEAEEFFKKSIHLFGTRVQAIHYANLGVLYHRWKKYGLAESMYKHALSIDSTFKSALKNLQAIKTLQH